MNRRQFVSTVGAATIAAGIVGCTPSRKENQIDVGNALPAPTPSPSPLPAAAVNRGSRMLMIFMLAVSQHANDGSNLVDKLFPADGSEPDYQNNHLVTDLKLDVGEVKSFVQALRAAFPGRNDSIRTRFDLVRQMYDIAFAYGKPDCPSPTALTNIIAEAKKQFA